MDVSVIVPTLDEEAHVGTCLAALDACGELAEVLVCDGGSQDLTPTIVRDHPGARLERAPRGRAQQMNHGAMKARGELLWFLHADCLPPPGAVAEIRRVLAEPGVRLGAFRFAVDSPRWAFRLLEVAVRVRAEQLGIPYGDQGLFMRREDFLAAGGFPEAPVMEDLYLVRALRRRGRVGAARLALPCSSRRWDRGGVLATSARNWGLVLGDWLGLWPRPGPSARVAAYRALGARAG